MLFKPSESSGVGYQPLNDENKFIRSKKDNELFPQLQVKDIAKLYTPDVINFIDGDGFAFKVASSVEDDYIEVTNLKDNSVQEFSNITEFKGATKAISVDSYLGRENIKREAKGDDPYTLEDFSIEKKKRLKFEKGATIDGIKFNSTLEVAKYYLDKWIEAVKIQTQINNIYIILGEGKCHRNMLDLPQDYKSNRTGERPLLLKEVRDYILTTYPSEMAPEGFETDEICDMKAFEHYIKFRKTSKVSGIKTSPDKDAKCTAGHLFDPTKTFHFNNPQIWLIDATDKTVGELELTKSGMKFTGLYGTAYQMVISDNSDFYGSRLTMPPEMKPKVQYGDAAFYKDFINLKTPKDVLQKVVDKFYDFYPNGVQFTSHLGNEIDEDTLWWCQQCFACQYMLRSLDDKTKFVDLLDRFGVDYSKITNNNKLTPPQRTFMPKEEAILHIKDVIESILKEDYVGIKQLKKVDLAPRLDLIKQKLESIDWEEGVYEMVQKEK